MRKRIYLFSVLITLSFTGFGQDLSILLMSNPNTACGHTNSETVNLTVFNPGPATITVPYDITYVVNGDTVTVTLTGAVNNIPPGTKGLSFGGSTVDMSAPGVYNFKSWITAAADPNHANDTIVKTVNSDANTVPGSLLQSDTVCQGANGDTLTLVGNTGGVVGWLQSTNDGASWSVLAGPGTDSSFVYSNLTQTTWYTVVVRSGSCPFDSAAPAIITVDPASAAGTINGAGNVCINSSGALTLTGNTGNVVDWESTQNPAGPWNGNSNTTNTFNYTNIQATDDTLFRVRVKLGVCPEDTTPVAALTLDPPSIGGTVTISGGIDTVCSGSNSPRTLTLTGNTGSVKVWEVDTGSGFDSIPGSGGSNTLLVNFLTQTSTYRAVVQSGACPQIVSTSATITVDANTVGGTINSNATVCKGSGGSLTLTGNVGAVQSWEQSVNGGGLWTVIAGETGLSYTYANIQQTTLYRVQVKNGTCPAIPSASATRTVSDSTIGGSISVNPMFDTVCANNNSALLTYAGGNGTIVDWEQSTNGGATFISVPGPPVTNSNYTFNNLTTTTLFRVIAQNAPCVPDFSDTITIEVLPASVAGTINGTSPICSGTNANLTLSGESGTIVTWRVSTNGGVSYSNVAGSAGQNNITPLVSANSLFHAVIQNGGCDADTTLDFAVNVDPVTVAGTVSSNATECGGNNGATLTLSGHTGNVIDWIQSINGGTSWTSVPGPPVTAATYAYSNLTQTTLFRARVQSGVCDEDSSSFATITVSPAAVGGTATIDGSDSICSGSINVTLELTGHFGTVIGWEASENGGVSYAIVPGATGTPEVFTYNFTTNTLFRALVQNGGTCDTVFSTSALMTVGNSSVGGNTAGVDTVCGGTNNGFVTLSGNVGDVVQWETSTNGGVSWTPQPNSDSVAYNYVGLNNTTLFRALVQDVTCPSDYSDTVQVVIIPAAVGGTVTYAGTNVCAGASNFALNLSGSSGTILRWEKSINGVAWTTIPLTTTSINDSNITTTTIYRAVLQSGACPEVPSSQDTVFVDQQSDAGNIAGSTTHCDTGNVGEVLITSYVGNVVNWQSQLNGGGFSTLGGSAGQDTISYLNLSSGLHEYKAIVKNGVCPNDTSLVAIVQVDPNVNPGTLSGGTSYCTFTNSTLMSLTGYTSTVVRWQRSTNGGASFTNISGSTARDTFTFKNVTVETIYRVIVSSGLCGNDTSNTQTISVGQSIGGTLSQSDSVCISGHTGLLQVTGTNGSIVTWQDSVSGGSWSNTTPNNAGFDTLRYTNLTQTTSYRVAVQSGTCDTSFSTVATITVSDTVFAGTLGTSMFLCDTTNNDTLLLSGYFGPIKNWQVSTNGGPFVDFSPAKTDSAYIFTNLKDSSSVFRVVMDGGVCGSDTSNTVSVEVGASLGGILATGDTLCSGNNMGVIRLTDYQGVILGWDSSTVPGVFAPMSHNIDSLVYVDLDDTVTYRVRVQNPGCPPDTSNEVTIVTVPGTDAGVLTGSRSFCSTTNTDSVILVGRSGNILLWQSSEDMGATWDTIIGQSTDTLIFTNLDTTTMYRVIIAASGICPNDTSNIVTIQIGPSDAGIIAGDTVLCAGDAADLFLTGFTGSVTGWESSTDGVIWNPITGTDTSQISINLNQTTQFRAIVMSDTCVADTSAPFNVNVDQPFVGSLITTTTQLCYGTGSDTIFISDTVDVILDWEFRSDTSASYTSLANTTYNQLYSNLIVTTHYRAFVKNGVCPVDTTEITLTVDTFTVAGTIVADDTICSGNNTGTLNVSGHIGNTFDWQSSTNGGPFTTAPSATNDSFYVYNNLTDTTLFRLVVASGGCPPDTTNNVQIVVKPAAIGGTIQDDTSYCKVPNSGVLNLTGYFGNIVGWQESINGGGFTNMNPPIVADSLTYLNIDTTTSYRVILSFGDCPDDTSSVATITILKSPITDLTADGPLEFCEPGQVTLTATGGPSYSWNNGDSVAAITASTSGTYIVEVTDTVTGCTDIDSMVVNVFPLPIVDAGNDVVILEGQSVALSATGASSYEWSPKSGLSDGFVPNPIATPTDSTIYIVTGIDDNGCEGIDSILVGVIPGEEPGPPSFTNLFTPNGDGFNDSWKVRDLAGCNTCKVAIYNRYGQQVLQEDNYQDDWEGTSNGSKLPDGTYYYVVETETGKIFKGAITILRGE